MNGAASDVIEENGHESDSDTNSEDVPEYYQPISAIDDGGSSDGENDVESRQLPNGYSVDGTTENGISSLDLNDALEQKSSDEGEEEDEERSIEEFQQQFQRALREDENRRNAPLFVKENGHESDSDTNSEDVPEYYQPISAIDDGGSSDGENDVESRQLPNGYSVDGTTENGISSLDLNDALEQKSSDEGEEEDEERSIEEFQQQFQRALREDENRRNAPLTAENTTRVMEAMRGVSFAGEVPQWASQVPEDRWIDQIRGLRQSPNT